MSDTTEIQGTLPLGNGSERSSLRRLAMPREQEPTVARTKDAVRSGAGGRYVYRLSNGAIVHPKCREAYAKKHATPHKYPSIEAGLFEGYPLNRFQLCDDCQTPIWEGAELAAGYVARETKSGAQGHSDQDQARADIARRQSH